MGNFIDNLWNAISALAWSDWFTLIILISFIVRGFIQGLAKEIISLFFVILAIILAWLYYEGFMYFNAQSSGFYNHIWL